MRNQQYLYVNAHLQLRDIYGTILELSNPLLHRKLTMAIIVSDHSPAQLFRDLGIKSILDGIPYDRGYGFDEIPFNDLDLVVRRCTRYQDDAFALRHIKCGQVVAPEYTAANRLRYVFRDVRWIGGQYYLRVEVFHPNGTNEEPRLYTVPEIRAAIGHLPPKWVRWCKELWESTKRPAI